MTNPQIDIISILLHVICMISWLVKFYISLIIISRSVKKIQSLKMFRASKISSAAGISRAFIPSCRVSQPIICRQNIQKRPCLFEISAPPPLPILCLQPARFYKTSPRLFIRRGAGYSGLPQRLKVNYKTGAYLVVMAMIIMVACLR